MKIKDMKIKIDTTSKIIEIEGTNKMSEIVATLELLFPNGEWREYSLKAVEIINNWTSPVIIREYPYRPQPYWWQNPTTSSSSSNYCLEV